MHNRVIAAVATMAAAVGLVASGAAKASAAPVIANVNYLVVGQASNAVNSVGCTAILLSEQVKAGGPAYVSGYLQNVEEGRACSGWLERSTNGGSTWSVSSAIVRAPSTAGFTDWVKLGEQKDGPGHKARVCFRVGTAARKSCTRGVSLKASAALAKGFPLPLSYFRSNATVGTTGSGECIARVSTTTVAKKAGTLASGLFVAFDAACTAFEQVSANGGVTWTTVSKRYSFTSKAGVTAWSFTAKHPDGTGRLARACVAVGTAKAHCTAGA